MVDIFNRLGMPGGLNATLPPPTPAPIPPSAAEGAFGGLMGNFASPTPQAPQAPQGPNPQGAFNGIMGGLPSAPQAPLGTSSPLGEMSMISGPTTKEEQFLVQCGFPREVAKNMAGGNGREGYRTANGDAGLQGANMPPKSSSWTNPGSGFNWGSINQTASSPQQGGGGMWGGVTRTTPQQGGPMAYGMFGGGAPQGNPMQMPAFQAPQPMPFMPQQPMPGLQNYNFSQQMGQTAPPSPMTGQMKGMFGVR